MPASKIIDGVIYGAPCYTAPDYNKNVGGFVIANIAGIDCLIENTKLKFLGIPEKDIRDISEVPDFLHEQKVVVRERGDSGWEAHFFPLKKEDIAPLGAELSKRYEFSAYYAFARYLASWNNGELKFQVKLSYYYSNVSAEEDDKFSL